jgi:hypothetical protein
MAKCGHGGTVSNCDLCKQERNLNAGKGRSKSEGAEAARHASEWQRGKPKPKRKK